MDIRNRNAIVTGAGRGIGKSIAMALADEGVNVLCVSRTQREVERTVQMLARKGVRSKALAADIAKMGDIKRIVDTAVWEFGSIDILVNVAGVLYTDGIEKLNQEDWDRTMEINVRGTAFLSREVMAKMAEKGDGYVINLSSTAALSAKPEVTSYCVSKCAVTGLTEALYKYGREHGIRVSAILPGVTATEMLRNSDVQISENLMMQPEDIAYCAMFLLKSPKRMVVKEIVPWATKHDII